MTLAPASLSCWASSLRSCRVLERSAREGAVFENIRPLVSGARGRQALETGDLTAGLIWAGQVQGLIDDIPSCFALIERIVSEARTIISQRLSGSMLRACAAA